MRPDLEKSENLEALCKHLRMSYHRERELEVSRFESMKAVS